MKPMITNGGPHPADKWADTTADAILDLIQIEADSVTPAAAEARQAKRDLRPKLFDIFNAHHDAVQSSERAAVPGTAKAANALVAHPINPAPHVDPTAAQVFALLATTPYADHFAKLEVRAVIETIIGQHTADVIHIERRYHQDRAAAAKGA